MDEKGPENKGMHIVHFNFDRVKTLIENVMVSKSEEEKPKLSDLLSQVKEAEKKLKEATSEDQRALALEEAKQLEFAIRQLLLS